MLSFSLLLFFFQAEDGIRDVAVTGVQTCALPISSPQSSCPGRPPSAMIHKKISRYHPGKMAKKKKITPESGAPIRLKQYEVLIFITGAVTLSLEVLASRIMTPYFGVSLYIWAGILSITLIFLALGYRLGGQMSQRRRKEELQLSMLG